MTKADKDHRPIPAPGTTAGAIHYFRGRLEKLEQLVCALDIVSDQVADKLGQSESKASFALKGVVDAVFDHSCHMIEIADKMAGDPQWGGADEVAK